MTTNTSYSYLSTVHGNIGPKGNEVNGLVSQNIPLLVAKLTQATTAAPTQVIIDCNYNSALITLTLARTSAGVYTLTATTADATVASASIFGASAATFVADNINYVDTAGTFTVLSFTWTNATTITINATNSAGAAKDAKVTSLPFKLYVYPA